MSDLGLNIKPEKIYSDSNLSIKDAVVIFANGCTGEIVSGNGLIFTNHHCGYQAIQALSSIENDYLKEGYWAKNTKEELACEGVTVKFLRKFIDVTDSIIPKIDTLMIEKRKIILDEISERLISKEKSNTNFDVQVKSFYNGNKYFLIAYEVFKDVRLVGTPPSSIGKFGADTDNWMWPRHTGDFAVFRVYSDSLNKPASYSSGNKPLHTEKFLSISLKGYKEHDYSMIMGFPGVTERYLTSNEVKAEYELSNPLRIKIRTIRQAILLADMNKDDKIWIQYASKYARSSNYWKYFIGQNESLKRNNVIENLKSRDNNFLKWVNETPERQREFGQCIFKIDSLLKMRDVFYKSYILYTEGFFGAMEISSFARKLFPLYNILSTGSTHEKIVNTSFPLKSELKKFYKDYNVETDIKVSSSILKIMADELPEEHKFPGLMRFKDNEEGLKAAEKLFRKSIFSDSAELQSFLSDPKYYRLKKDKLFRITMNGYYHYHRLYNLYNDNKEQIAEQQRIFTKGLLKMNENTPTYPDANFSMRLTYGKINSLQPSDAVFYNYKTTMKGIMEKENPDNWEFLVPEKLKKLYADKDFSDYSENGEMPVAFLTDNDITGGNSGSPVMNADGQLIGIAFDGNWEGLSGEFAFLPPYQRTIAVDIRYVLFIIDKFGEAGYLLKEMDIKR